MMGLNTKIKFGIVFPLLLIAGFASAQKGFKYGTAVKKVDSNGFYRIDLQPALLAKSESNFDLRLMDAHGNFIPYIPEDDVPPHPQKFIVFPEAHEQSTADSGTVYIAENAQKIQVSTLWVKLNNTAVKRTVNLSGSDDLIKWYAIEEDIPLQEAVLNNDGSYLQSLSFPGSKYHYFKLAVNDKHKTPIKFLESGIYTWPPPASIYLPVLQTGMARKDSDKTTYITIQLKESYPVDLVRLTIAAPKYYKRTASVYWFSKGNWLLNGQSGINSTKPADVPTSGRTGKLQIQIDNGDNLPLDITKIEVFEQGRYIFSYLEAGKQYKLVTETPKQPNQITT